MLSCFLVFCLVFSSAGVQVFFGFKILDNQANAGQSCAVSLPLFCSFMLSRSTYCFGIGYREREESNVFYVSDFPNSRCLIYDERDRLNGYEDVQRAKCSSINYPLGAVVESSIE